MGFLSDQIRRIIADYAARRAERAIADHENRELPGEPYPTAVKAGLIEKIIGVTVCTFMVVLSALVTWMALAQAPIDGIGITASVFCAITLFLCMCCYDSFMRRIEWSETHVNFRRLIGTRTMPWSDIIGLEKKSYPRHFRIAFRDGTGFGVFETMRGSRYFMRILGRRLDPDPPAAGKRRRRRKSGKKAD